MCDYSLHNVASTPAKVGDQLVTTSFALTGTRGFAAADQPNVVVCIPPGAEIAFEKDVEIDRALGLLPKKRVAARVARFRQINMDQPYAHHDALEFPDGLVVNLTHLAIGQRATVLQLPASGRPQVAGNEAEAPATATEPRMPVVTGSLF